MPMEAGVFGRQSVPPVAAWRRRAEPGEVRHIYPLW
jgi:hypothetical protein